MHVNLISNKYMTMILIQNILTFKKNLQKKLLQDFQVIDF